MSDDNALQGAIGSLKKGKVIAYPTETLWGLGADLFQAKAIEKIFDLKKRSQIKALTLLVSDIPMARQCAHIDDATEKLMHIFWPGPVTFVIKAKDTVPKSVIGGSDFVGLRCSSLDLVRDLMAEYPNPITSTSANIAGAKNASTTEDLAWLPGDVHIVPWDQPMSSLGSTVVKIENQNLEILRAGDVPAEQIELAAKKVGLM